MMMMMIYDDDDVTGDDDNCDDDEVDWLAWFSAKAVNSPLPNSPLSVPTKMFFYFNRGHHDGSVLHREHPPLKRECFLSGIAKITLYLKLPP